MALEYFEYTEISRYQRLFTRAFYKVLSLLPEKEQEGRTGVYVSFGQKNGLVIVTFHAAEPNIVKAPKYHHCVGEKVFRLGQHPEHNTSAQSANEELEQYPGAFRTAEYDEPDSLIVSVSGLPSGAADTAVGLLALWNMKEINPNWAEVIGDGNHYWTTLHDEMVG